MDANKGITSITYNHLNLPSVITTAKGTITYTYDAAGNKMQKQVAETGLPVKTTLYAGGLVYENDTLQFIGMEEGRLRPNLNNGTSSWAYDYMLKDHLGNVRMVLTDEQKTNAYPVASLETNTLTTEKKFYTIPDASTVRVSKSTVSGYPADNYTTPNDFVHKLSGNGTKVGSSIVLKVMAGDKVHIRANSWYKLNGATPQPPVSPLTELLTALISGVAAGGKATMTELGNNNVLTPGMTRFLNGQSTSTGKPKAYLNWVLFDEQLNLVPANSSADPVGADNEFKTHVISNLPVTKNGYLYIYVSNETPNINVFFDNLQVTHLPGPILEETHYYPFGLTMAGISSRAINFLHNKRKYNNGNELESMDFSDGSGLEMYDAVNRMYDPQIGRFWQIDELAEASWEWSPFFYANNNPISFNDPFGLDPEKSTEDNPKQLQEIVIISTKRMSYWAKMNFMYDLQRYTGGDLNRIESPHLREEMLRLQGHYNFRQKVADNTRKSDDATLQIASWLMPAGLLTKARYVKFAVNLFKIRRGVHFTAGSVDLTTQMIINKGDIKKVNIVSTVSSVLIGNPILSTVPGSLANLSLNGGLHLNSMSDFNVYKNIVLSSAGNIGGEKLGIGFKLGSTIPGSQFLGESIGSLSASAYDEMTNFK